MDAIQPGEGALCRTNAAAIQAHSLLIHNIEDRLANIDATLAAIDVKLENGLKSDMHEVRNRMVKLEERGRKAWMDIVQSGGTLAAIATAVVALLSGS